jgi:hypothetical protein
MKRHRAFLLTLLLAGCAPNYKSGETECSDSRECPGGYSCSDDGTIGTHYCFDNTSLGCPTESTFYCSQSKTCWGFVGACSTVTTCATSKYTGAVMCKGAGYVPDCNAGTCRLPDDDAPTSVGKDAGSDTGKRDSGGGTCTSTCPDGQLCLSGQCCVPPEAGGVCTVNPACGCPSGQVCYPSSTTHAMACFPTTNLTDGADCSAASSNCKAGLGCFGGICKRYCKVDGDCPAVGGVQVCGQTHWSSDGTDILGVLVCDRICDPAHPQSPVAPLLSCPAGFNCASDVDGASHCLKSTPLPAGSSCSKEADCSPGYYCSTAKECNRYCLSSSDCPLSSSCQFTWSTPQYAGSRLVGYCD